MTHTHFEVRPYEGGKITEPGIYSGVSMDAYHGDICDGPSVSSSHLRKAEAESLDEVWDSFYMNPDRAPEPEKKHFALGRAAHTLLLGEAGFREEFLIRPETYPDDESKPWSGNSGSCKKWLAEAALLGKTVLTVDQVEVVRGMAARLAAHPTVQTGILNGLIEHSIFWQDEKTGLWVKVRPDVIPTDSMMVGDLKTSANVQPQEVRRAITNHGYHQQMALIREGIFNVTGRVTTDHILIFIKSTRPFSINHKPLTAAAMYRGHQQNRRALDRIAECLKSGYWPGPDDDEVPADLTDWREKQLAFEEKNNLLPEVDEPQEGFAPPKAKKKTAATAALEAAFPEADEAI